MEGKTLSERELSESCQQLNVWEGTLESRFKLSGSPVEVTTLCHPDKDELAYRLKSPLFSEKRLGVRICFPFPSVAFGKEPAVWDMEDSHRSWIVRGGDNDWIIKHQTDDFVYYCRIRTSVKAALKETSRHNYFLELLSGKDEFTLLVDFRQMRIR